MDTGQMIIILDPRYSYESSSLEELAEMLEQQEKVVMMMTMMTLMVVMMMTMMTLMVVISIKNGITNLLMVGVLVNCSDDCDINDDGNDGDYDDQVGKVAALAFLLNGSETELFLCEEAAVKITLARFDVTTSSLSLSLSSSSTICL